MKDKKVLVISLPVVWCIRNFILSGINKQLEAEYDIYYAVPPIGKNSLTHYGISQDKVLVYSDINRSKEFNKLFDLLKIAHRKRNPTRSDKIYDVWFKRDANLSLVTKLKLMAKNMMASLYMSEKSFKKGEAKLLELFDQLIPQETIDKLNAIKPDLVLSTAFVVNWEWSIVRAAKKVGAKAYTFVLSFDNLTSRGYLPIGFYDKYMLWNNSMKKELEEMFLVNSDKIYVTGTPQFDYHLSDQYKVDKSKVEEKFNLKNKDYILYCANHFNLTPNEPVLLDEIMGAIKDSDQLTDYDVIIRLHPMDKYERWDGVLEKYPNARLSLPWKHDDKEAVYWGNPSLEDVMMYSNMLRHAAVTINIGSTVSLDAAMVDCPVVCVGYHPDKGSVEDKTYYNFHFTEHYAPIMATNAVEFATNKKELIDAIVTSVSNRQAKHKEREVLNASLLELRDGNSAERILDVINE